MLVQHFSPSSSPTTTIPNSFSSASASACSLSSSLRENKTTTILSLFFNSESTGFQSSIDENIRMGCTEKLPAHFSTWSTKLTSVMEIHRKRYSQLNSRFKQHQRTTTTPLQPVQQPVICPVILPSAPRPQPRQQTRSKQPQQTYFPLTQTLRRPNTTHVKDQQTPPSSPPTPESNHQYITLANLTKILHVLQTHVKLSDSEASINMSISTANSARPRVQQHLQETATRWWKSTRSSDIQTPVTAPSLVSTHKASAASTQILATDVCQLQQQELNKSASPMIVLNSTRQGNTPSTIGNETSGYSDSVSSTETQPTTVVTSIIQPSKTPDIKRRRQEPLIMQPRGMRLYAYDHHRYYNNQSSINFLHQHRLIRQT